MFHPEILTEEQKKLLSLVKHFKKEYYLVGGTAIALHIGHRKSIDFDLFTTKKIQRITIKKLISENAPSPPVFAYEADDQIHLRIGPVKVTFFQYPYEVPHKTEYNGIITMPSLLDLAAMKAFAFAQRAKWKDYVDIYFMLKHHFTVREISKRTEELFNTSNSVVFTEKLFRQQISFFSNIDFSEPAEFIGEPIKEDEIKKFLTEVATTPF